MYCCDTKKRYGMCFPSDHPKDLLPFLPFIIKGNYNIESITDIYDDLPVCFFCYTHQIKREPTKRNILVAKLVNGTANSCGICLDKLEILLRKELCSKYYLLLKEILNRDLAYFICSKIVT